MANALQLVNTDRHYLPTTTKKSKYRQVPELLVRVSVGRAVPNGYMNINQKIEYKIVPTRMQHAAIPGTSELLGLILIRRGRLAAVSSTGRGQVGAIVRGDVDS